jgi:hypothetical protein
LTYKLIVLLRVFLTLYEISRLGLQNFYLKTKQKKSFRTIK